MEGAPDWDWRSPWTVDPIEQHFAPANGLAAAPVTSGDNASSSRPSASSHASANSNHASGPAAEGGSNYVSAEQPDDERMSHAIALRRGGGQKLLQKLSVDLLKTFNEINDRYYEEKRKRLEAEKKRAEEKKKKEPDKKKRKDGKHRDSNYVFKEGLPRDVLNGRYEVEAVIGKGSFGLVVRSFDRLKQEYVAVKIVRDEAAFFKQAQIELDVLRELQSDTEKYNIVTLKDSFMHKEHQCIVFELLDKNLYELLRNTTKFQGVSLPLLAKFGKGLLSTLAHLASRDGTKRSVIHCDLKPENILLRTATHSAIKVIDFGSACFSDEKMYSYIQSRFYRAPEVLLGLPYSNAIDMWSLGCILVEMHSGHPLFDGEDEESQMIKQIEVLGLPPASMIEKSLKKRNKYFEQDHEGVWRIKLRYNLKPKPLRQAMRKWEDTKPYRDFEDLISQMLIYEPKNRIKPKHALAHPFFRHFASKTSVSSPAGPVPTSAVSSPPVLSQRHRDRGRDRQKQDKERSQRRASPRSDSDSESPHTHTANHVLAPAASASTSSSYSSSAAAALPMAAAPDANSYTTSFPYSQPYPYLVPSSAQLGPTTHSFLDPVYHPTLPTLDAAAALPLPLSAHAAPEFFAYHTLCAAGQLPRAPGPAQAPFANSYPPFSTDPGWPGLGPASDISSLAQSFLAPYSSQPPPNQGLPYALHTAPGSMWPQLGAGHSLMPTGGYAGPPLSLSIPPDAGMVAPQLSPPHERLVHGHVSRDISTSYSPTAARAVLWWDGMPAPGPTNGEEARQDDRPGRLLVGTHQDLQEPEQDPPSSFQLMSTGHQHDKQTQACFSPHPQQLAQLAGLASSDHPPAASQLPSASSSSLHRSSHAQPAGSGSAVWPDDSQPQETFSLPPRAPDGSWSAQRQTNATAGQGPGPVPSGWGPLAAGQLAEQQRKGRPPRKGSDIFSTPARSTGAGGRSFSVSGTCGSSSAPSTSSVAGGMLTRARSERSALDPLPPLTHDAHAHALTSDVTPRRGGRRRQRVSQSQSLHDSPSSPEASAKRFREMTLSEHQHQNHQQQLQQRQPMYREHEDPSSIAGRTRSHALHESSHSAGAGPLGGSG